jgi:hypothetical protein
MKIWHAYGSEHSMNLVIIGSFKKMEDAEATKVLMAEIREQTQNEPDRSFRDDPEEARFSEQMLEFFKKANLWTLGPTELEQFKYDVSIERDGDKLVLKTDESDVSGFIKLMIDKGARIEIFSAHDYPDRESDRKN